MSEGSVPIRIELRDTLKLAAPMVLSQAGHMSMGLVDTLVAGHISTTALAGLGLASNFYWTFTSICAGALLAFDTYFSQAAGAGDERSLSQYLGQSFWSCVIVGLVSAVCLVLGEFLYLAFSSESATRDAFSIYMRTVMWSLPSLFFFFILQRYWQARHVVLPFALIIILANVLNLAACLALGLGHWGFPRLGVKGLALATVVSRYAMLIAAFVFTAWRLRIRTFKLPVFSAELQRRLFTLGLPAASHTALEIGAFTIATFVVATLGPVALAANHICLMMAAFTFMFPLGFSSVAAVRVGTFIGAGQPLRARLAGWHCIGLAVSVMTGFALIYLGFPRVLLGWFTSDPEVIRLGAKILIVVALFQIGDGIQVSTTGALRGLGNTRSAMIANLIGHYPIGLALGLLLCFGLGFGVVGLWVGLATGLVSVATMLLRAWSLQTRDMTKVRAVVLEDAVR
jgi:MATE family multidrug resistance protein